jgi:hypothetical protein
LHWQPSRAIRAEFRSLEKNTGRSQELACNAIAESAQCLHALFSRIAMTDR